MTQASLLRHYDPQLMLGSSTAEAAAAPGGEIAFFNDTAIYFYRCLIGSSITNIETQSEPVPQ